MRLTIILQLASCFVIGTSVLRAGEPDWQAIDRNENGVLEQGEIFARDLAVISRYASLVDLDIKQPMPIEVLQRGRDRYIEQLDGGGRELQIARKHEFGRVAGSRVRPFGVTGAYAGNYVSGVVRQGTITTFLKFDANRDGLLTVGELSVAYRYYSQLWMRGDHDANGILTFAELANALRADRERRSKLRADERSTTTVDGVEIRGEHRSYATRLMSRFDNNKNGRLEDSEIPKEWKDGSVLKAADRNQDGRITSIEMQIGAAHIREEEERALQRKNDPALEYCQALAANLIRRFDLNKDQSLHTDEWQRIGESVSQADLNENGLIVESELEGWLYETSSSQSRANLVEGSPNWFVEADADLDGQVTLSEYLGSQPNEQITDFMQRDRDSDGIVTPAELEGRGMAGKTRYSSRGTRVLEAGKEIYSEICIRDAVTVGDMDVQVSIAKDRDDDLELRLVGPDGTTAVLFYTSHRKAWGGGRLFDDTIIDEEAPQNPRSLPRPPAHRSFRPQGMGSPQMSSLSAFNGKPARGVWRLVIANKGRAAGLLQGWAMLVKPSSVSDRSLQ